MYYWLFFPWMHFEVRDSTKLRRRRRPVGKLLLNCCSLIHVWKCRGPPLSIQFSPRSVSGGMNHSSHFHQSYYLGGPSNFDDSKIFLLHDFVPMKHRRIMLKIRTIPVLWLESLFKCSTGFANIFLLVCKFIWTECCQ